MLNTNLAAEKAYRTRILHSNMFVYLSEGSVLIVIFPFNVVAGDPFYSVNLHKSKH